MAPTGEARKGFTFCIIKSGQKGGEEEEEFAFNFR